MASMNLNVSVGIKRGTNINDVNVPAKLRERRKTGLKFFDDAMGGEGLVPSTVHMLTGVPGAGKSTLLRQLADSIVGQGHICIMNSGEESVYQVKMATERLKLKNGFIVGEDTMVGDMLAYADQVMKANPKKQLFLLQDSLQTLNDGKYKDGGTTGNTPVRCVEMITDWAKRTYGIAMFVGQCTKSGEFAGKNTIKHAVDAHAHLYFDEEKKSETYMERLLEVTKNRWGVNGVTTIVGMGEKGLYEKGRFERTAS